MHEVESDGRWPLETKVGRPWSEIGTDVLLIGGSGAELPEPIYANRVAEAALALLIHLLDLWVFEVGDVMDVDEAGSQMKWASHVDVFHAGVGLGFVATEFSALVVTVKLFLKETKTKFLEDGAEP